MAKLLRGKIVIEREDRDTALISAANPLRDGSTFASDDAPWVGAEQRWRSGIVPPPHEEASGYLELLQKVNDEETQGLTLTMNELETVLSSLPPAPVPPRKSFGAIRGTTGARLLSYTLVAGLAMIVTWAIMGRENSAVSSSAGGEGETATSLSEIRPQHKAIATTAPPPVCKMDATAGVIDESGQPANEARGASTVPRAATVVTAESTGPAAADTVSTRKSQRSRTRALSTARKETSERVSVLQLADALAASAPEKAALAVEPLAAVSETADGEVAAGNGSGNSMLGSADTRAERSKRDDFSEATINSMATVLQMAKVDRPENVNDGPPTSSSETSDAGRLQGLSRASIARTMVSITPEVEKCRRSAPGRVVVELEVAGNTGRVIDARAVEQTEVGITAARCAVRAVKLAKFPPFEKSSFTVTYAFDI